jgi:hypothetical protein
MPARCSACADSCIIAPAERKTSIERKENVMRKSSWTVWLGAAALLMSFPLSAQQTAKEAEKEAGSVEQYEKILKKSGNHEILGRLEGKWIAESLKVLIYGTPLREVPMKDTFESRWLLDNNFLEVDSTQDFGNGYPVKSKIIMGYNGADKEFWRLFMAGDPRGTWSKGVYIRSKDTLIFRGEEHDPVSGDKYERRDVYIFGPDKDKFQYQLYYFFADGSEFKVVDGFYARAKAGAAPAEPTPPKPGR